MADPTRVLRVAWATAPFSTSPSWTTIANSDIRDLSINRGRSRELDEYRAGTMDVVLDNRDRLFDPEFSTSVKPMRRAQYKQIFGGSTYVMFDGFIDGIDQNYQKPREATATLKATDGMKVLAAKELVASVYEQEVRVDSPVFWARFEEPSDATTAIDSIGGLVSGTVVGTDFAATGLRTLPAGNAITHDVNDTITFPSSPLTGTGAFSVEFLINVTSVGANHGTVVRQESTGSTHDFTILIETSTLTVFVSANHGTSMPGVARSTTGLTLGTTHHVVVKRDAAGDYLIFIDGVDRTDPMTPVTLFSQTGGRIQIGRTFGNTSIFTGFVGRLDELAFYASDLSAARISAHNSAARTPWNNERTGTRLGRILDAVSWPAAQRAIDTGDTNCQSTELGGNALAYGQKVAQTEEGLFFIARNGDATFVSRTNAIDVTSAGTFGDSGSELRYVDLTFDFEDQNIVNEAIVSRARGVAVTVSDATSQTNYLKHSFTRDGLLHDSDLESVYHGQFLVNARKDPALRITSMTIAPQRDPTNLWPVVLGAELGSTVVVRRRPQGVGSVIEKTLSIEGIEWRVSPRFWTVKWTLSPARTGWRLGTAGASELGQTTILGF